jgi:adenylate cyclase
MFTDLAGYTSISERLGDRVVPLLADYLEVVSTAVLGRGGTIDKFIGDGVMAFWGAPVPNERHALDACVAALNASVSSACSGPQPSVAEKRSCECASASTLAVCSLATSARTSG